jgi:hypothetical protein
MVKREAPRRRLIIVAFTISSAAMLVVVPISPWLELVILLVTAAVLVLQLLIRVRI